MSKHVRFAPEKTVYSPSIFAHGIASSLPTTSSRYSTNSTMSPYPSKTNALPGHTPYVFIRNPEPKLLAPASISAHGIAFSSPTTNSRYSTNSTMSPYPSKTDALPGHTPHVFIPNPEPKLLAPVRYAGRRGYHPLLEPSAIMYDLRDCVSAATTTHNNHSLSIETLHESAFFPTRSYITIISSYLPWTIKVHPQNGSYITLQDILTSIHSDLRTNITPTEFQLLPSQHHRNRATRAYEQRYERLRRQLPSERHYLNLNASESEKRAGMKRVDFLMSHTKFLGIRWQRGDEWKLHVASPTMEL